MVRNLLNGRFENTAFVLMSPNGKELTRKGSRSPLMTFGSVNATVNAMDLYLFDFEPKNLKAHPTPPDFDSLKQSLNVASADQRPLVIGFYRDRTSKSRIQNMLAIAFTAKESIGRFHFDQQSLDTGWPTSISPTSAREGLYIIHPDEFGLKGKVAQFIPESTSDSQLIKLLTEANNQFIKVTQPKVYSSHVSKGRRLGIKFNSVVPYGEDRNGDGIIDSRGQRNPRRSR